MEFVLVRPDLHWIKLKALPKGYHYVYLRGLWGFGHGHAVFAGTYSECDDFLREVRA